jgi:small subunit ribosomal protein S2
MEINQKESENPIINAMFEAGVQYGYSKRKRHPSVKDLIFGVKNRVEIWNLEKTASYLGKAKEFVSGLASEGKQIMFVAGKNEARNAAREAAMELSMPYVAGRWIGGTLTNINEIRIRINRYEKLIDEREKGELLKYTKKERLMIDREIEKLERNFKGLTPMKGIPAALVIVDPKAEHIALSEAKKAGLKTIALLNTDCNLKSVDYPVPGNDASERSIKLFIDEIAKSYKEGLLKKESPLQK